MLAPKLAGRVDVHMAGYRKGYEQRGRAWLTVDGVEVASFCEFAQENAWRDAGIAEGHRSGDHSVFCQTALATVRASGVRDKADLLDAMGGCIGQPVDQLLKSPDPLVRALVMLDRRLGKRRLVRHDVAMEDPLVVQMHTLRCKAEGIATHA